MQAVCRPVHRPCCYNHDVGKQSSSQDPKADITLPIAGEHFGAGIPIEQQEFVERRKSQRNLDDGSPHPLRRRTDHPQAYAPKHSGPHTVNPAPSAPQEYRLRSRSEMDFPEAYLPVAKELWDELTPAQQAKALHLQAVAMEKVGFEKGAPKFFIEDFDPATGQTVSRPAVTSAPSASPAASQSSTGTAAYPATAVLAGILLGSGAVVLIAALLGVFTPLAVFAGAGGAALLAGGILAFSTRG